MKHKLKQFGWMACAGGWLFAGAALLLGFSAWALTLDFSMLGSRFEYAMNRREFLPWHMIHAILSLALAFGVGRWLQPKQMLRFWWAPVAFLMIIAATPTFRFTGDIIYLLRHSPGWALAIFAVMAGLRFALPAWSNTDVISEPPTPRLKRAGFAVYLAVLLFAAIFSAAASRHTFALSLVLFGTIGLTTFVVLRGWRRWVGMAMTSGILGCLWVVAADARAERVAGMLQGNSLYLFQALQSLLAIHEGGLTGFTAHPVFVPESTTDFMFARVCMGGGLVAGLVLLVVTGMLLISAWWLVARQHDPRLRTVAASIAALWSVCALAHVAINVVWWPTMGIAFPFLSLGRIFLLMHAILLGVMISIARSAGDKTDKHAWPARGPVTVVQAGILVLLALFAVRLGWIVFGDHSMRHQRQTELARMEAREQEQNISVRGRILDVHGRVLAQHGERHYVCADPQALAESPDRHLYADMLRMIGLDAEVFEQRTADTGRRYVRLTIVPETTAEAVRRMNLRGIFIDSHPSRDYPIETPLTHIAGFVNTEMVGASGVEQARHAMLAEGRDVRLTLDADLQQAVQSIAGQVQAREVQIVVVNPRTGAIRAAAQTPATHAAVSPKADPRALTWRSNMDAFEPGGLVQPLLMASALDLGVLDTDTRMNTENGSWTYHGIPMRDPHPFAEMSPEEILIRGANIGMAKIGIEMGTNALHEAFVTWGLDTPAATHVPGAGSGILPHPGRWSKIEITRLPIGHSLACTLMQLVRAYTAFFNDGRLVEPYLIEDEMHTDTNARSAPVSATSASQVRGMLERVVAEGTGRKADIEGVTVFGKTAVVQKAVPGGYAEDRFQTAFIGGFMGANGEPVLIAVWLDEPASTDHDRHAAAGLLFSEVATLVGTHATEQHTGPCERQKMISPPN
jgi:cell division protein FtsI (penicillin-binding protein 3)